MIYITEHKEEKLIMASVREIHNQAMAIFNQAEEIARLDPDDYTLTELYYKSCLRDVEAARQLEPIIESEPTRAILFISAASLALRAKKLKLAEELIGEGLQGIPNHFHSQEMQKLLKQVTREQVI